MNKLLLVIFLLSISILLSAQVNYTANQQVPQYDNPFRFGVNPGYHGEQWDDEDLADLSTGTNDISGVGVSSWRVPLKFHFLDTWGFESELPEMEHYKNAGLKELTAFIGYPNSTVRDTNFYCPDQKSGSFENLYEPIWDGGANGTPYNDDNHFAAYVYKTVDIYKEYVKFWEIWNEPDFDLSGNGWKPEGMEGNWFENTPGPCDTDFFAPVYHYIRMLRISYDVIKTVDPSAYVAIGGIGYESYLDVVLRHTDNPIDGSVTPEYPWLGGAYFDVLSYHVYPHINGTLRYWDPVNTDWVYSRHSDAAVESVINQKGIFQNILTQYGYNNQPYPEKLWIITEANIPRLPFEDHIGKEETQRNFMIKVQMACIQNEIHQFHAYRLAEKVRFWEAEDGFDVMGLYKNISKFDPGEEELTEAGIASKTFELLTANTVYDKDRTAALNLPNNIKGGAFAHPEGHYTYLLWGVTETDQSEQAYTTYDFPTNLDIVYLKKQLWDHSRSSTPQFIEPTNVELNGTPIFFTETMSTATTSLTPNFNIQITPNPFEDNTYLNIELEERTALKIDLIDINGIVVSNIQPLQLLEASTHQITIAGNDLVAGIYICRISTDGGVIEKKIIKF